MTMTREQLLRGVLIGIGVLAIGRGAVLVLFGLHPGAWLWIAIYLAAGSAVHDLLIGPISVTLGRLLRRPLRNPVFGNALRGACLGADCAVLAGLPLLGGARRPANPTVIPGRPGPDILLSVLLMLAGAALAAALSRFSPRLRWNPFARRGFPILTHVPAAPETPGSPPATPPPPESPPAAPQ